MRKSKNNKGKDDQETVFEKIYQDYYVKEIGPINRKISEGKHVYPCREAQQHIVNNSLNYPCKFRYVFEPEYEMIKPLSEGDSRYPFLKGKLFNIKDFFGLIHLSYLIPYFTYGKFAYELAIEAKDKWQDLINIDYQIQLPIKFPGDKSHYWYTQISRILSINENNQVISHINFYLPERELLEIDEKYEHCFIKATIFTQDKSICGKFQNLVEEKMAKYFREEVFIKKQHLTIIRSHMMNPKTKDSYESIDTRYFYNKEISNLMTQHTGYTFTNIKSIASYLDGIGAIRI